MSPRRGWHGIGAHIFVLLLCIGMFRLVAGVLGMGVIETTVSNPVVSELADTLGVGGYGTGDDLRRGDLHPDLVREGQVVRRDGRLVVLTDAEDPNAEEWRELDADDGPVVGPVTLAAVSVVGGSFVFFCGLLVGRIVSRRLPARPIAPTPEPDEDLVVVDDDPF